MASARLAVLAVCIVGCQCLGIPAIPAGRRAQYYTQKSDGSYQYGYDTAEGLFQVQQADNANEVQGTFGAEGGETKYTAGVGGFVVTDHKKASASAAYAATKASAPVRYATAEELNTHPKQVEDTPEVAAAKVKFAADYAAAAAAAEAAPDVDIITGAEPIKVEIAPHFDDGLRYSGPYATINAEGQVEETAEVRALKAKLQKLYNAAAAAAEAAPDLNIIPQPDQAAVYSAPAPAPSALYGAPSAYKAPAASKPIEIASFRSTANDDGSYEFSYETSESSRHESADAANNVKGNFEFVADDAQRRRVDYSAGAKTGFIASGGHLPVSVSDTAEVAAAKASFKSAYEAAAAAAEAAPDDPVDYSAAAYSASGSATAAGQPAILIASQPYVSATYSAGAGEIASFRSTANTDGSYEFFYSASDSSRHESADAANKVKGNFEFVADDAQRRRVDYSAGAETGFVASGTHLPVSVSDTAEVAAAKASFKSAFESAAAAAAAAPDSTEYQAPAAVAVKAASPAAVITPTAVKVATPTVVFTQVHAPKLIRYATLEELTTLPKPVVDTPEVAAAKVSFQAAYDAQAALAKAAPDVNIITGPAPAALYSGPAPAALYSAPASPVALYEAPAATVKFTPAVVSLDAEGNLQDTPEVAAAKVAFQKTYAAQAAAAEAAPDVNIITGTAPAAAAVSFSAPAPAAAYGAPAVAKASFPIATKSAAHHGAMRTHVFDGITLMVSESGLSPSKFGYGYE